MQEDAVGTQPRVVFMHKCMQLECWPATAIVSQLHQPHISLPYVIMDSKSKPTLWIKPHKRDAYSHPFT